MRKMKNIFKLNILTNQVLKVRKLFLNFLPKKIKYIDGKNLYFRNNCSSIYKSLIKYGSYSIHISNKFKKITKKDDLFINIGANIGTISRSLSIF